MRRRATIFLSCKTFALGRAWYGTSRCRIASNLSLLGWVSRLTLDPHFTRSVSGKRTLLIHANDFVIILIRL